MELSGKSLALLAKILVTGIVAPAILIGAGGMAYRGYGWLTHGRYAKYISAAATDERQYPLANRLCKEAQAPIYVGFANESSRTVTHIEILVEAQVPGVESNILDYLSTVAFGRAVSPGEHYGSCHKFEIRGTFLPTVGTLQPAYRAIVLSVTFAQ
jgi:hypothetical protein